MRDFVIFVEGVDDKALVEAVLTEMSIPFEKSKEKNGHPEASSGTVRYSKGWANLRKVELEKTSDSWKKVVLVIFDADMAPDTRRTEIITQLESACPADQVFLFPNNRDSGTLETLLAGMVKGGHRGIVDICWRQYSDCIAQKKKPDGQPYNAPTDKSKMHEYAAAIDAGVWDHQGYRKCFANPDVWDYSAPVLEPLKSFLKRHLQLDTEGGL